MFTCTETDCDRTFSREGNLKRHVEQAHSNGHATVEDKPAKKKRATAESPECEICPEAAVLRVVVPDLIDWKLCERCTKVTLRFVEPL